MMHEALLKLPERPGTVIAIGAWWLVRLPGYEGAPSAWELLPFATEAIRNHAESIGVKAQCVYGDEWVLAEAEQGGGYLVIADPREEPSGVQYFKPVPALGRSIEYVGPPIGERVQERANPTARGTVRKIGRNGYVDVEWDDGVWTTIEVGALEPEQKR